MKTFAEFKKLGGAETVGSGKTPGYLKIRNITMR